MINVLAIGRGPYSRDLDLCLTARALGASEITFIGKTDKKLLKHLNALNKAWGGTFKVSFAKSYQEVIKSSSKYVKVCLTRYGIPLQNKIYALKTYKNIVLIVPSSATKDVSKYTPDFSISVTSQPHSGSAAVAIFLHEFYSGRELAMHFENAKYKLVEKENGLFQEMPK